MTEISLHEPHTPEFAERWRELVCEVFDWSTDGPFVLVPSLLGGEPTASYLPYLTYGDLTGSAARALCARCGSRPYLIRTLAGEQAPESNASARDGCWQRNQMVTLRLPLDADLWDRRLRGVCRNQIRKARKSPLVVERGTSNRLSRNFYDLHLETMHRYGMPVFPRRLLDAVVAAPGIDVCLYVAYLNARPAAGIALVRDYELAWVPWAASQRELLGHCPNHLVYWTAIEDALATGAKIFDFGRSPYGGTTYDFKKKWGAEPVALEYLRARDVDPYRRYGTAQALWRHLPRPLARRLGPRLCRYVPEL
jgi:hypothetical protein